MTGTALRYFETIRHLQPEQVLGRAWNKIARPRPDARPAPGLRTQNGLWMTPAVRAATMTGPDSFRFLGQDGTVRCREDWNRPDAEKLWLYNLHYFDDLNASEPETRTGWHEGLVARWIAENPPGTGNGWEPYPLSLRLVNWIKWALGGVGLEDGWKDNLAVQARWLERHLEWHILGNHLFANAKALIFAGHFFGSEEADRWLARGAAILSSELHEQTLADGGHFELSPMYHSIILEDVLDLINLAHAYPGIPGARLEALLRDKAEAMLGWLDTMRHPDRQISFFNDAAFGIAAEPDQLGAYAERLGILAPCPPARLRLLEQSGYVRLEAPDCVALLDVARIGPDYLPGHAHADSLSFELSLFGQRVIVNGGTSAYGLGEERTRQRSTAAHSTVEIAGENSSDVWAGFRVGRRAYPQDLEITQGEDGTDVSCAHSGYRHLPGKPVHRRTWSLHGRKLTINDTVHGGEHPAVARFHLAPDSGVVSTSEQEGRIYVAGRACASWRTSNPARVAPSTWHPEFGKSVPSLSLELPLIDGAATLELSW